MAITLSDRDVGLMAHLTAEVKERFRAEASRRKMSMSALTAKIIEEWLESGSKEDVGVIRSNKRGPKLVDPLRDIPLPLEGDNR